MVFGTAIWLPTLGLSDDRPKPNSPGHCKLTGTIFFKVNEGRVVEVALNHPASLNGGTASGVPKQKDASGEGSFTARID